MRREDLAVSYAHGEKPCEPIVDKEGKLRFVETQRPVGSASVRDVNSKTRHGGSLFILFDKETGEVLHASFSK